MTKELIDQLGDLPTRNCRFCVVCGKELDRFLFAKRLQKTALYCSRKCFGYKPPAIIQLERAFGKDIKEILIETTKNYDTLDKQQQSLGKSSQWLYLCIRKYFKMSLTEFMASHAIGPRKERYKKKWERIQNLQKQLLLGLIDLTDPIEESIQTFLMAQDLE